MSKPLTVLAVLALVFFQVPAFAQDEPAGDEKEKAETVAIQWKHSLEDGLKAAKEGSKLVLALFTSPARCQPCRMLEKDTWPDAGVAAYVGENFIPVYIDTGEAANREVSIEFAIRSIPTVIVMDTEKKTVARLSGYRAPEDMLKALRKASALPGLEKKAEENAEDAAAAFALAEAYTELGRGKDAAAWFEKVCSLDKDNSKGFRARALFELGKIAFGENDIEEAVKKFKEALELDPENKSGNKAEISLHIAFAPAVDGETEEALKNLEKFIKDFPDEDELCARAMYTVAALYGRMLEEAKAVEYLEKLVEKYPETAYGKNAKNILKRIEQQKAMEKKSAEETGDEEPVKEPEENPEENPEESEEKPEEKQE